MADLDGQPRALEAGLVGGRDGRAAHVAVGRGEHVGVLVAVAVGRGRVCAFFACLDRALLDKTTSVKTSRVVQGWAVLVGLDGRSRA